MHSGFLDHSPAVRIDDIGWWLDTPQLERLRVLLLRDDATLWASHDPQYRPTAPDGARAVFVGPCGIRDSATGRFDPGVAYFLVPDGPIALRPYLVDDQDAVEVRSLIAAAFVRPDLVRVRFVVGPPTPPDDPEASQRERLWWREHGAFRIRQGEVVLGEHETAYRSTAGVQRVLVGFILPAAALQSPGEPSPERIGQVARALVDSVRPGKEQS